MGLALESEDGALCEDIAISNITMRDVVSAPLFWRLGARLRGPKESTRVGTLQRIVVNNLVSNTAPHISSILSGIPDHAIRDVKISNVYIQHGGGGSADDAKIVMPENADKYPGPGMFGPTTPSQGFFLRHVTNLEMSHVEIQPATPDQRPSFYLEEVNRADFIAVTAPATPPAFALNKVTDLAHPDQPRSKRYPPRQRRSQDHLTTAPHPQQGTQKGDTSTSPTESDCAESQSMISSG